MVKQLLLANGNILNIPVGFPFNGGDTIGFLNAQPVSQGQTIVRNFVLMNGCRITFSVDRPNAYRFTISAYDENNVELFSYSWSSTALYGKGIGYIPSGSYFGLVSVGPNITDSGGVDRGSQADNVPFNFVIPPNNNFGTGVNLTKSVSVINKLFENELSGYDIDFETNGGSEVPSMHFQNNLPDTFPVTTKEGSIFTGWYTDSSLIFPAVPGAPISEDTTLYAGWRPAEFTVTFNTNGGEPVGQLTKVSHLPDPLPTTLKIGNDFGGWFTESELLHPAVPGAAISQNTTLYAKWVEQQSTDIHVPTVSTPSLLQTGFVTMWNPTLEEVRELSNFLWTTNLFDNLRKLFNDPMEAILFLGIVPFNVNTAERGNIYFGNLNTDVESTPIVQQYYTLDFGDLDMSEYYHSFLDYEPATTVEIFLPFCGTHKLSANEVMGSVMNLKYNVDVFTGTCVAMLTITKPGIDSVMYSFEGNVMATIPVTAKNYSDLIRGIVSAVASAGIKAVSVI